MHHSRARPARRVTAPPALMFRRAWAPRLSVGEVARVTVLLVTLAIVLTPLAWMVVTSVRTQADIVSSVSWIPHPFTWENYRKILDDNQIPVARWFLNTTIAVTGATMLTLLVDSLAAYALARLDFPGKDAVFILILSSMLIPGIILVIPQYAEFANLIPGVNLIDTYAPLILPYAASVFGVFLLRQFYLGIPREMEEAAMIDGAGKGRRWWQLIVPTARAPLLTLGILTALTVYNDYFWPLVATTSDDMRTMTVGVAITTTGTYANYFGPSLAFSTIAALPIILIFLFLQRYFVESIALTGLKG